MFHTMEVMNSKTPLNLQPFGIDLLTTCPSMSFSLLRPRQFLLGTTPVFPGCVLLRSSMDFLLIWALIPSSLLIGNDECPRNDLQGWNAGFLAYVSFALLVMTWSLNKIFSVISLGLSWSSVASGNRLVPSSETSPSYRGKIFQKLI